MEAKPEKIEQKTEVDFERELDILLEDPANEFLSLPMHQTFIEEAETAAEALQYAKHKILERSERTFIVRQAEGVEGIDVLVETNVGVSKRIRAVLENPYSLGSGNDADVLVENTPRNKNEIPVCYKIAKAEVAKRGRNTLEQEMDIQSKFFAAIEEFEESKIGVPAPIMYAESGNKKVLTMEKLPAQSIDDILRQRFSLPAWFTETDVEELCHELEIAIAHFHSKGLYHRDLHLGNIMINTTPERSQNQKLGYIIDFGLSGEVQSGFDPYKKEANDEVFTYADDYGRIKHIQSELIKLIARKRGI